MTLPRIILPFALLPLLVGSNACKHEPVVATDREPVVATDRLEDVVEIDGNGSSVTCAVTSTRKVYCWGEMYGGDFHPQVSTRPRHVDGADGLVRLAQWWGGWIGEMPDGTLIGWPANDLRPHREDEKGDRPSLWPGIDPKTVSAWRALPTGFPRPEGRYLLRGPSAWVLRGDVLSCDRCESAEFGEGAPGRITGVGDFVDVVLVGELDESGAPIHEAACVLHEDGTIECLRGERRWKIPLPGPVRALADSSGGTAILLHDGRIFTTDQKIVPHLEARVPPAVLVTRDEGYLCAVTSGGEVWCWYDAVVAEGHYVPPPPARVRGITEAIDVDVRDDGGCALTKSGNVLCWGSNERGQCGVGYRSEELDAPEYVVRPVE